jgi:FkbM family methyltransferase
MLIKLDQLSRVYGVTPRGVIHIGASSGQEIRAYCEAGIKNMVMIEALDGPFGELVSTANYFLSLYPDVNIYCLQGCVSDKTGQSVTFHVSDNDAQSSSFLKPKEHLNQHPTVHFPTTVDTITTTLPDLLDKYGIDPSGYDFLNMDIQGAEFHALRGMGDMVTGFDWIYLEANYIELYEGCGLALDIDNYLIRFGFVGRVEKRTGHGWGDKLYVRG